MATYQITLTGAYNTTYTYPWTHTTSITDSLDPLKRVRTVDTSGEETMFERSGTNDCTVIVYNRDSTNTIRARFIETGGATIDIEVPPGRFASMPSSLVSVDAAGGAFSAFTEWDKVTAQAMTGTAEVEVLVIEATAAS